jgi:hypothetical protein
MTFSKKRPLKEGVTILLWGVPTIRRAAANCKPPIHLN